MCPMWHNTRVSTCSTDAKKKCQKLKVVKE